MSKTVDDRVVEMRFDNRDFESNVRTSMSTLDKLKNALKLPGVSKGIDEVSAAAKKVDLSGMSNGVETVNAKFSAMQVVAMTALSKVTSAAMSAGKSIVSALTLDPVMDGFREYETQIKSVQTILANTQSKGTTIDQVNKTLDELNKYADQTIYNFSEMTRNIGTFTAAGVDLDKSVTSIKGVANLAAMSGSTSQQASTAMYQLSQAIAAGKVQLTDWNSVVNAGMGGEVFQNALKRTAKNMGKDVDGMIEKYGSFRESLTKGEWMTADVLTETLTQLSGAYSEADLIAKGYTEQQAKDIVKLADTATKAATEVKTFTGLIDTAKEALGSGWAQSWEIIIGDYDEAKKLFTGISNTLGDMISKSADARNELLQGWKDLGGRNDLIESFKNVFEGLGSVIKPIKEAFSEIFPPMTAQRLADLTSGLKDFTSNLKLSDETSANLKSTFKGLFAVLDIGKMAFSTVIDAVGSFLGVAGKLGSGLLGITGSFGEFLVGIRDIIKESGAFAAVGKVITGAFDGIGSIIDAVINKMSGFGDIFSKIGNVVSNIAKKITSGLKSVFDWISENIKISDVLSGIGLGMSIPALKNIAQVFGKIKKLLGGGLIGLLFGDKDKDTDSIKDKFSSILDGVHDSLESFTNGIKVSSLVGIAAAVTMLSSALRSLSELSPEDAVKGISAIGGLMAMLSQTFKSIAKTLTKYNSKGIIKSSVALIAMATAIKILASAMKTIGEINPDGVARGLIAIGIGLAELVAALKVLDGTKVSLKTSVAIIALAEACKILADALTKFSALSWDEIARGLVAMGGALGELVASLSVLNKFGGFKSIFSAAGLLIAVQSLDEISENLKKLGDLSWDEIGRGLTAMGGALGELVAALAVLNKFGNFKSIFSATGLLIAVQSLDEISENLKKIGDMSWEEIGRGLVGMGGALGELGATIGILGKVAPVGSVLGAEAVKEAVKALDEISENLKKIGEMSWEDIGRGLTGMGVALGELGTTIGVLGKVAPVGGILGAEAIKIAVQSLDDIAENLKKIGDMSWEDIGQGLVGMAGALAELGGASFLTGLGGLTSIAGAGTLDVAVKSLDELADAFKKFGEMSWGNIGQGLAGMAGALAELGGASFLTGLGGVASVVGAGTLDLAVQGLNELAEAFQKFGEMSWDEIGRGLTAMGGALGETALGGLLNTFSGFGAGAIAEMAGPLGDLAEAVKKWEGVSVPEGLGEQLGELGKGVRKFTFDGWGAEALSAVAAPIGTLAESVKKWSDVTFPEGMQEGLEGLANGIGAFNFDGWGGEAIATFAGPFGTLADSVKKWADVTVPEGIATSLQGLAMGVSSFNFAGWGGDAIATVAGPLGTLADSVKKWADVTVPENLEANLKGLANGIKHFYFAGLASDDVSAVAEPLGNLAGAVAKWKEVTIPEGIKDGLEGLANGVKAFNGGLFSGNGADALKSAVEPIGNLAGAIAKWKDVTIPEGLGNSLTSIAGGLRSFQQLGDIGTLTNACTAITNIGDAVSKISEINFGSIAEQLTSFSTAISSINISADSFANLGKQMVDGLVNSINGGIGRVQAAATALARTAITSFTAAVSGASGSSRAAGMALVNGLAIGMQSGIGRIQSVSKMIVSSATNAISSQGSSFQTAGTVLVGKLASGITNGKSKVTSAVRSTLSSSASTIRSYYSSFYSSGSYIAQGLANGISSGRSRVVQAAASIAKAAAQAARDAAGIASPSKVFYEIGGYMGQGLVNSLGDYEGESYKAGYGIAESSADGLRKAISKASAIARSDMDLNPTIRPVLDLSNVKNGAASIDKILSNNVPIGAIGQVNSINRMMNQKNQNAWFDDVITSVDKLRKDISNLGNTTYNINGITYDDGSNVSNAVKDLTRAIKIERRV